jgi:ribonuclease HI
MKIIFYTDGSSRGNPGKGGWGVYVKIENNDKEKEFKLSGGSAYTTNNRMELTAVIRALKFLDSVILNKYYIKKEEFKNKLFIIIKMDSQYVKNGITIWIKNWEKNDWKNSNKKDVLNKDLWKELNLLKKYINNKLEKENFEKISFEYVKGHAGLIGNEIADSLATEAADKM